MKNYLKLTIGFVPEKESLDVYHLRFALSISPPETTQIVVTSHEQQVLFNGVGINGPYGCVNQPSSRLLWVSDKAKSLTQSLPPNEIVLFQSETNRKVLRCFEHPEDDFLTSSYSICFNRQEVDAWLGCTLVESRFLLLGRAADNSSNFGLRVDEKNGVVTYKYLS